MLFSSAEIGKIYKVKDVVQNDPCQECPTCTRLRLMEIGFIPGSEFQIVKFQNDIWIVRFISENDGFEQTIALRNEETVQIILED